MSRFVLKKDYSLIQIQCALNSHTLTWIDIVAINESCRLAALRQPCREINHAETRPHNLQSDRKHKQWILIQMMMSYKASPWVRAWISMFSVIMRSTSTDEFQQAMASTLPEIDVQIRTGKSATPPSSIPLILNRSYTTNSPPPKGLRSPPKSAPHQLQTPANPQPNLHSQPTRRTMNLHQSQRQKQTSFRNNYRMSTSL